MQNARKRSLPGEGALANSSMTLPQPSPNPSTGSGCNPGEGGDLRPSNLGGPIVCRPTEGWQWLLIEIVPDGGGYDGEPRWGVGGTVVPARCEEAGVRGEGLPRDLAVLLR